MDQIFELDSRWT